MAGTPPPVQRLRNHRKSSVRISECVRDKSADNTRRWTKPPQRYVHRNVHLCSAAPGNTRPGQVVPYAHSAMTDRLNWRFSDVFIPWSRSIIEAMRFSGLPVCERLRLSHPRLEARRCQLDADEGGEHSHRWVHPGTQGFENGCAPSAPQPGIPNWAQ